MITSHVIYIADDQADFCFILEQIFKRSLQAYTVHLFTSGQTLLDALSVSPTKPSLILLDHHMPNLNGYQTLLRLKGDSTTKPIPVVMMSAEATQGEILACYEAGVNSFLEKKTDFFELTALMEGVCHYWFTIGRPPVPEANLAV